MKYRLYDAPAYPEVPYEFYSRGIFLKGIAQASITQMRGLVLELSPAGLFRGVRKQVSFGRRADDFRRGVAGVFVDPVPSLRQARFTPETSPRELMDAISCCGLTRNSAEMVKVADLLTELKPMAIYGYDLDWVLMLER